MGGEGALRRRSTTAHFCGGLVCVCGGVEEGAASLGLLPSFLPHLHVRFWLCTPRLGVRLWLRQLCNVKDEADAQVELPENGPQFRDQVKLHDLTQEGVVSGCMSLELSRGGGRKTQRSVFRTSNSVNGSQSFSYFATNSKHKEGTLVCRLCCCSYRLLRSKYSNISWIHVLRLSFVSMFYNTIKVVADKM